MHPVIQRFLVACVLSTSSLIAPAAEKHALLGTWSVDIASVQSPNPPKSVTLTLEEAAGGAYHMSVVIEAPDGSKSKAEGTFKPDGTPVRVTGSEDIDVITKTMPSRRMLVMGGALAGRPASTRVWSLSDDGSH